MKRGNAYLRTLFTLNCTWTPIIYLPNLVEPSGQFPVRPKYVNASNYLLLIADTLMSIHSIRQKARMDLSIKSTNLIIEIYIA